MNPAGRPRRPLIDLIISRLVVPANVMTDCWTMTGRPRQDGYFEVTRGRRAAGRTILAHRAVWEVFNGPIQGGLCACHHCDNRACVNPAHLFLGTRGDNNRDAAAKGRMARGEGNGQARLTAAEVLEIRDRRDAGETQNEIARSFGVSQSHVSAIVRRELWSHLRKLKAVRK